MSEVSRVGKTRVGQEREEDLRRRAVSVREDHEKRRRREDFSNGRAWRIAPCARSPRRAAKRAREWATTNAKLTIALFFRAAFAYLTMLQSTLAYTTIPPSLRFSPFVLLLRHHPVILFHLPPTFLFSFLSRLRSTRSFSRFHSNIGFLHPLALFAFSSPPHPLPPTYPFADNKHRPPFWLLRLFLRLSSLVLSPNHRQSAQCAMHFCD